MNNEHKDHTIVYFLQQLAFIFERHCDQVFMEQLGLGYAQYKILINIKNSDGIKQNVLAFNLHQTEASISRQIKLLKNRGMITSSINPKNRRERLSILTEKGERISLAAEKILDLYNKKLLVDFSEKDLKNFTEILSKINQTARLQ
jgi:DNA-binding MarR family transcriptional regulator